jgi:2-polyprenyl-3-methyl-5-hydroxy-6-metoxy-1,4-benzoquinol methylase
LITKEQAVLAYRLMLGREPENEDVINNLCQNTHSEGALRDVFLKSLEFKQRMEEVLQQPQYVRHRHPFILPKIPVETEVTNGEMIQMFERIRQEWEHLGETEPYWSVITQPQYYQAEFKSHQDQFYESGNYSCQIFLASLRRCDVNPADLQTCLEVGCGVGRVTAYLAAAFKKVIATDISRNHLDIGIKYLESKQINNVEYKHWTNIQQLNDFTKVDAVYSIITLQHNPPPVMVWMLKNLFNKLNRGGVAYIQIPTYRNGYIFEATRYLHSTPPSTLEMHFLPQNKIFDIISNSNCKCLEIREDAMVGDEDKMLSNSILVQKNK